MVSAARRFGEAPTARESADRALVEVGELRTLFAEALARIAALEARADADDALDGPAPAALPPQWVPIKAAARVTGFSPSGVRKRIEMHRDGPRWWKYRGSRLWIDTAACPRKTV